MIFTFSWLLFLSLLLLFIPHPYGVFSVVAVIFFTVSCWVALVGGFNAMREVIEAYTQQELQESPPQPPPLRVAQPLRRLLIVGAARGLGLEVSTLARSKGTWEVHSADVALSGEEFVDLTRPATVQALCASLARSGVRHLHALVLAAGVCDAEPVKVLNSSLPRMVWVNFLGHAVVLQELKVHGVVVDRIIIISSGSYVRGSRAGSFFPVHWTPLGAMAAYAQSKYLLTIWASWLRRSSCKVDVTILNPGPMRSAIGDPHVPLFLWPVYGLMKEILFPLPAVAARAVLHFTEALHPEEYVHIRTKKPLIRDVTHDVTFEWLLEHARVAFREVGYRWRVEHPAFRQEKR